MVALGVAICIIIIWWHLHPVSLVIAILGGGILAATPWICRVLGEDRTRCRAEKARALLCASGDNVLLRKFIERYRYYSDLPMDEVNLLCELLQSKGYDVNFEHLLYLLRQERDEFEFEELRDTLDSFILSDVESLVDAYLSVYLDNYYKMTSHLGRYYQENRSRFPEAAINVDISALVENRRRQMMLNAYEKRIRDGEEPLGEDGVDLMTGVEFENLLGRLYSAMGYEVSGTPGSGDQGADLLLERIGERSVVQAKRYEGRIGNKAVQEVVAARSYYDAQKAIVVTNSDFTRSAVELARKNNVLLVDGHELQTMLREYL